MFFKSKVFKQSVLFLTVFAVSGGVTMYMLYQKSNRLAVNDKGNDVVITPAERMLNSLLEYQAIGIDAKFNVRQDAPKLFKADVSFKGLADMSDLATFKINGDLDVHANGSNILAGMTYYSDVDETGKSFTKMYLDYNNSHLKLDQADLFSFIDMIPSLGGNIKLPEADLGSIDADALLTRISSMTPEKNGIADVDANFIFTLDNIIPGLDVYFKTDADYNFKGLLTNEYRFEDMSFKLNVNVNEIKSENPIKNPEIEKPGLYQDFRPALNLVEGVKNVFSSPKNTIGLDISVTPGAVNPDAKTIKLLTDISYDTEKDLNGFKVSIVENERSHDIDMLLKDSVLYVNQGKGTNLIKFKESSTTDFMALLRDPDIQTKFMSVLDNISKIANDAKVDDVLNTIKNVINGNFDAIAPQAPAEPKPNPSIDDMLGMLGKLQCLNNWITAITVEDNTTKVSFDLTEFGLNAFKFDVMFTGDNNDFLGVDIQKLNINGTEINIHMEPKEYSIMNVTQMDEEKYISLDPAMYLVPNILTLAAKEEFRFIIKGDIVDNNPVVEQRAHRVDIDGDFQFNLVEREAYGFATIDDGYPIPHKVQADLNKNSNLYVKYNQNLKGKMSTSSIMAMGSTIAQLLGGQNEEFNNSFNAVLQGLQTSPIFQAMKGDIGLLLQNDAFKIIEVAYDETHKPSNPLEIMPLKHIKLGISNKLFGLDEGYTNIVIDAPKGEINEISVVDMVNGTSTINFHLFLKSHSDELKANRLVALDDYINLDDLKILLDLGIKTVTFKDYHLKGNLNLDFQVATLNPFTVSGIPVDVRVRNDNGKLILIADIDVPVTTNVLKLFYPFDNYDYHNCDIRKLRFMYKDGMVYGDRYDRVNDIFHANQRWVHYYFQATDQNFLDNILYYLCEYGFTLNQTIMNQINKATDPNNSKPADPNVKQEPIHYDDIVTGFSYVAPTSSSKSQFKFDVNMGAVLHNNDITDTSLTLYGSQDNTYVDSLFAGLQVNLLGLFKLLVKIDLNMVDAGSTLEFAEIDTFANAMVTNAKATGDDKQIIVYKYDKDNTSIGDGIFYQKSLITK